MTDAPDQARPETDAAESLARARALLAAEEEQRMRACAEEIRQVLERYGMRLEVTRPEISLVPVVR